MFGLCFRLERRAETFYRLGREEGGLEGLEEGGVERVGEWGAGDEDWSWCGGLAGEGGCGCCGWHCCWVKSRGWEGEEQWWDN